MEETEKTKARPGVIIIDEIGQMDPRVYEQIKNSLVEHVIAEIESKPERNKQPFWTRNWRKRK